MSQPWSNGRFFLAAIAVLGTAIPGVAGAQFGQANNPLFGSDMPFEGLYVGIHGAATRPSVALEVASSGSEVDGVSFDDTASLSFGTDAIGSRAEFFGGAGLQSNSMYYGVEVNFALGHSVADDELEATEGLTAKVSGGYGLSVRLGGVLEEGTSMFYGRLGYQFRDLEVQAESEDGSSTDSSTFAGLALGVGLEYRSSVLPVLMRFEGNLYQYADDVACHDLGTPFARCFPPSRPPGHV
ncbi:outer membrane protein [Halorhodospira halophila]|uniref:outer membrane protein n=1 Tax=Halorhodospira halophila TaxID=1053 RepID=UPI001913B6CF|nr:outer membrane beta-barrel protein [Halorhodospira halophila]